MISVARVLPRFVGHLRMLCSTVRTTAHRPSRREGIMVMAWQAARHNAALILKNFTDGSHPVNLEAIADRLGIDVAYRDLKPGMSGFIFKDAGEKASIYIDRNDVPGRQRFTLAHELGHYVERMVGAKDDSFSFTDTRSTKYDLHEFYADEFAGALLMPEEKLRELQRAGYGLSAIADSFGVTTPAVAKRIERLKKHS